ncbi:PAS domain S-box protein [Methanohalophilus portucalensis FDF-1]|uniref:PAS domain S-box protein n=2 Tax=Methanohalophilus portucalensis TaxID=39664 RepID=A0A1X7NXD9_9EURY|nr:histidine kinase dimerization/phosphoacceptor domain -containing protein [Methanohalophilus portucalensis]ATU08816.1 histidine kinase [Methanohalophilus portucalensis]RNI12178.1 PAS domain S-box protein [Methanohalophilus portucalensis FDF-1]SMH42878.1 PAS domain S-box-containing protein [Methanohalophilus portucalensis FDF-1]
MAWKDLSLRFKLVLYIVVSVFLILSISSSIVISTVTSQEEQLAYDQSAKMAQSYANQFNADMKSNMAIARNIATTMGAIHDSSTREGANDIIKSILEDNPQLIGTYSGFEPDAFDGRDERYINTTAHDGTGRFLPYWNRIEGDIDVEPLVDYSTSDYYQLPKHTKQDVLTEPYFYQGALIVSYVSPIIENDEFIGIGGVDVGLDYVDNTVSSVKAFETGYLFMVSNTGVIISHPTNKDWISSKTLRDFDNPVFHEVAIDIEKGKNGHVDIVDPSNGKDVILFYEPISTGNYSILLSVPKDEIFAGVASLRSMLFTIYTFSIVFMGLMAYLIAASFTNRINGIVDEFRTISDSALEGDFNVRANTDVDIDFKKIPEGLNEVLDSLQDANRLRAEMEAVVNRSPVVVFKWKSQKNWPVEFVSRNISQFGYTQDEFTKGHITYADLVVPEDLGNVEQNLLEAINRGDKEFNYEYRIITRDREIKWVEERTFIGNFSANHSNKLQGIILDINERKKAEEALKKMEKIRIKEIHHRIKNNLQVVSGLLYLESLNFKSDEVMEAFKQSENRVRSIALIHEKLYHSENLTSLNLSDYVEDLVEHLINSYNVNEDAIEINLNVENLYLDMDSAVPLGIIINELTSNALQHAFIEGEEGEISIDFFKSAGQFILKVEDSGGAFPDDIDFKNTESLGLQLVSNLVSQIEGDIKLDTSDYRTCFRITFRDKEV